MSRKVILTLLALSFVLPPLSLSAWEYKGVKMENSIQVDNQTLVLNGMALRKKFIFKVYVAGLYIPQKEKDAGKILQADTMRRGVMHFLRSVDASKINEAWQDGLKANTPGFSQDLKKQFDSLCSWMEEVKDGSLIVFTYIPEKGTAVEVKGKLKGIIPGKDFADALFKCWIGPKPGPGEDFKKNLLGIY
jgi:hypothetical protein